MKLLRQSVSLIVDHADIYAQLVEALAHARGSFQRFLRASRCRQLLVYFGKESVLSAPLISVRQCAGGSS